MTDDPSRMVPHSDSRANTSRAVRYFSRVQLATIADSLESDVS
jgi:hypothetical protein